MNFVDGAALEYIFDSGDNCVVYNSSGTPDYYLLSGRNYHKNPPIFIVGLYFTGE